jgi:hypothetical protein
LIDFYFDKKIQKKKRNYADFKLQNRRNGFKQRALREAVKTASPAPKDFHSVI